MSDFLEQMAAGSQERLQAAKREVSEAALLQKALAKPPPPLLVPNAARFDLIVGPHYLHGDRSAVLHPVGCALQIIFLGPHHPATNAHGVRARGFNARNRSWSATERAD